MRLRALRDRLLRASVTAAGASVPETRRPAIEQPSLALYVHMPWCVRKCPYCDFNSHQLKSAAPDASYIDALIRDFDAELPQVGGPADRHGILRRRHAEPVPARRFRPAARRPAAAHRIRRTMPKSPWKPIRAPSSAADSRAIGMPASIACRWARRPLRRGRSSALGRIHSAEDTHRAVEELRAAKLGQFQSRFDVRAAAADARGGARGCAHRVRARARAHFLLPAHARAGHGVSCAAAAACPTRMPRGGLQCAGQALLAEAGYVQYEVSAYAREGARCRHNLNYWLFGDYVGIGAGAHGKLTLALPAAHLAHHEAQAAARIPSPSRAPSANEFDSRSRICRSNSC